MARPTERQRGFVDCACAQSTPQTPETDAAVSGRTCLSPRETPVYPYCAKDRSDYTRPCIEWRARQSGSGGSSIVPAHNRRRRRRKPMQRFPGEPVCNPVRVLSIRIALRTEVIAHDRALNGAPDRTRTCYPRLRRPVLYPDELRAQ